MALNHPCQLQLPAILPRQISPSSRHSTIWPQSAALCIRRWNHLDGFLNPNAPNYKSTAARCLFLSSSYCILSFLLDLAKGANKQSTRSRYLTLTSSITMALPFPQANIKLDYPLYAVSFDPQDANRLVVGGGGGAGRSGVANKIVRDSLWYH